MAQKRALATDPGQLRSPLTRRSHELAVILVNWRNEQQTLRCARAVFSWQTLKPSLIVVANESNEASKRILTEVLRPDQLICSPVNLGYGGGNNLGVRRALSGNQEFVLLLNSDAEISEAAVVRLLERLQANPEISILGPVIHEGGNGGGQCLIGGRDIALSPATRIAWDPNDLKSVPGYPLHEVDYVSGTIFLARRELFEQIGLLDERFFFSGEIADLCKRAKDRGHRICVDLSVEAGHDTRESVGPLRETLYTYYSLRNRFLYVRKHYPTEKFKYFTYWGSRGVVQLARTLRAPKPAKARAVLLALLHGGINEFGNQNAKFNKGRSDR